MADFSANRPTGGHGIPIAPPAGLGGQQHSQGTTFIRDFIRDSTRRPKLNLWQIQLLDMMQELYAKIIAFQYISLHLMPQFRFLLWFCAQELLLVYFACIWLESRHYVIDMPLMAYYYRIAWMCSNS